jgi:hypothetical protein
MDKLSPLLRLSLHIERHGVAIVLAAAKKFIEAGPDRAPSYPEVTETPLVGPRPSD